MLDIETSNLNADYGYVICYCIKEVNGPELIKRTITPTDIRKKVLDKKLMEQFLEDIKGFDRLIVYWGKDRRFDIPYLRSRCLKNKLDFPKYRELFIYDLYDLVRNKLKLSRNYLKKVCDYLGIPSKQTEYTGDVWIEASTGDKKALDTILQHCVEDVVATEKVWVKMREFSRTMKLSI